MRPQERRSLELALPGAEQGLRHSAPSAAARRPP